MCKNNARPPFFYRSPCAFWYGQSHRLSSTSQPVTKMLTPADTGILSLDVLDAREMSPVEARLIGKAINRACKIAALGPES